MQRDSHTQAQKQQFPDCLLQSLPASQSAKLHRWTRRVVLWLRSKDPQMVDLADISYGRKFLRYFKSHVTSQFLLCRLFFFTWLHPHWCNAEQFCFQMWIPNIRLRADCFFILNWMPLTRMSHKTSESQHRGRHLKKNCYYVKDVAIWMRNAGTRRLLPEL